MLFRCLRGWDTVSKGRVHEVFVSGRFSLGTLPSVLPSRPPGHLPWPRRLGGPSVSPSPSPRVVPPPLPTPAPPSLALRPSVGSSRAPHPPHSTPGAHVDPRLIPCSPGWGLPSRPHPRCNVRWRGHGRPHTPLLQLPSAPALRGLLGTSPQCRYPESHCLHQQDLSGTQSQASLAQEAHPFSPPHCCSALGNRTCLLPP